MKVSLLTFTLSVCLGTSLAFGATRLAQDPAPPVQKESPAAKEKEPAREKQTEEPPAKRDVVRVVPKRLGGNRLNGIKVKPKTTPAPAPTPAPVGPPVASGHSADDGHDHAPVPNADTAPPGRGGLTFEPGTQIKRFGDLVQGDVRNHIFHAKSTGEEPLVISSVTKSCGCTRADVMLIGADGKRTPYVLNQPIPVGQEFEVHAEIDTTGKTHLFRSDITLMTNDPRKGVQFSLEVNVKAPLVANPRSLNLAQMKATEVKKGQVLLTSELNTPFKLHLDPNIPLKNCEVELVPTLPNEEGKSTRWVVKVTAGPNMSEGTYYQSLRLLSDMPKPNQTMPDGTPMMHEMIVFVTAQVLGPVTVNPPHLSFGILRPGQAEVRKATIKITDEDWKLEGAPQLVLRGYGQEFPYGDDFKASIAQIPGTDDWELTLDLLGLEQDGSGAFRGLVEVQLGHPAKPILEVGFSGAVRAGVVKTPGQAPR